MISAPSAAWTVSGTPRRCAARSSDSSGLASVGLRASSARPSALAHAEPVAHPGDEGIVHLAARLLGHAEGAVRETGGDVLRRGSEARDLVVVDRRGAVHGDVGHDAAAHQLDEHGGEPGLHDVAAEHHDDATRAARRIGDGAHHRAEVARDEDVGECVRGRRRTTDRPPAAARSRAR